MEFDDNDLQIIRNFCADSANPRAVYALGALFWSKVCVRIGTLTREKGDIRAFVDSERDFLDFGLLEAIRDDYAAVKTAVKGEYEKYPYLKVGLFSDWLAATIEEILEGNQKELLHQDIKKTQYQIQHLHKEREAVQQARRDLLIAQLSDDSSPVPSGAILSQVGRLQQLDEKLFESLKTKKAVAKGMFFSVEQRRAFVEKESRLKKEQERYEGLASQIKQKTERATLNNLTTQITDLYSKVIDAEDGIARMEKRIEEIEQKRETMSVAEIESRALRSIEYIRDLVKLCARRLRMESCSFLRPKDPYFTAQELSSCLNRILEFDPRVFCNDRVNYLGKPSVLLVPGNGNAIYDWKNNLFIVPLVPPSGDFVGSIAAAVIEYRLDVDDEKKLLNSYVKLPEYHDIKSIYRLKGLLIKDYIVWMTSEYKGYRVLSGDVKRWFEHEIAPSRKEISCPPEYQQFAMDAKEFKKLLDDVEKRLEADAEKKNEDDLWIGSILNYQQGRFDRAYEYTKSLLEKNKDHLNAWYNLGHIGMRISRKQDALLGFGEFSKRNPQSWRAAVAREHMRRLQAGS
jgi:tetratricopeptide (TPR) repeat protein